MIIRNKIGLLLLVATFARPSLADEKAGWTYVTPEVPGTVYEEKAPEEELSDHIRHQEKIYKSGELKKSFGLNQIVLIGTHEAMRERLQRVLHGRNVRVRDLEQIPKGEMWIEEDYEKQMRLVGRSEEEPPYLVYYHAENLTDEVDNSSEDREAYRLRHALRGYLDQHERAQEKDGERTFTWIFVMNSNVNMDGGLLNRLTCKVAFDGAVEVEDDDEEL